MTSKFINKRIQNPQMYLFYVIQIREFETRFCSIRISNRLLCAIFSIFGLILATSSFLQHVYSWFRYEHIFYCRSAIPLNASVETKFLAYDIVIFDFGLMHRILGTTECVANYLDGGYMRAGWCIQHASALTMLLVSLTCLPTPVWLLWPALFMQSSYVLGMAILTMATAPKLLEAISGMADNDLNLSLLIYISGLLVNWLFAFVLWHYYWGVESKRNHVESNDSMDSLDFPYDKDKRNVKNDRESVKHM